MSEPRLAPSSAVCNDMIGSLIVIVDTFCVIVSPLTFKSPVMVRLSLIVTSLVECPMDILVPLIPVPIATDSELFAVSIIK